MKKLKITGRPLLIDPNTQKDEFAGLDAYFQKGKLAASNSEASVSQYAKS